jgi:hypothetical protein
VLSKSSKMEYNFKSYGPSNKKVNNSKNKPLNATKASSQTPVTFLVCCFVVVRVQK